MNATAAYIYIRGEFFKKPLISSKPSPKLTPWASLEKTLVGVGIRLIYLSNVHGSSVSARHWCIVLFPTDLEDSIYYDSLKDAQSGLGTCAG
jgi:hypothetical protein